MKIALIRILSGSNPPRFLQVRITAALFCALGFFALAARATTLRIVSYNIDCEDQSSDANITGPAHSLPTVIQAIGLHHIGTNAQQVDVINCEELNSTTLSNFVAQLNAIYGAGTYTFDTTTDTNTGGGPDGLIYNTHTVQVVSARALRDGHIVLLQSSGSYVAANSPGGGTNGVTRSPMLYQLRPIGFGTTNDFYMYVSHARSSSDDTEGDARYAEAQELRSDAKYKLAAGSHILYAGDWNLFNGSGENAYLCLTGQTTSDNINWADTNTTLWANTNQTQGYDPTSKTSPPTTTTFANTAADGSTYLYDDSTDSGSFCMTSRLDIQLPNAMMYAAYNSKGGVQLAPDHSDPFDTSDFPSSQYPYAFEVFGNNGTTPRLSPVTTSSNHSLDDLASTVPNATTVYSDILEVTGSDFVGSDHYPIVGDYVIVTNAGAAAPAAGFSASPTNGTYQLAVTFTDTSTGSITNRFWNFGDGAITNTTNTSLSHTYNSNGLFTVSETVSGSGGSNSLARTNYITVTAPPPVAGFSASPTNGAYPLAVTFTDSSTGGPVTNWSWSFGDGSGAGTTNNSVVHAYIFSGVFTVKEVVTGPGGSSTNTLTNYITVITPFQAWQLQYFGCTNCPQAQPAADADGTGQSNYFKYIAGLNPTNPASVFTFSATSSIATPGAVNLTFNPAVAGRTYTPQFETSVTASNWQTLTTISTPVTNGSQVTITDTNTSPAQKFYRINIQLQ